MKIIDYRRVRSIYGDRVHWLEGPLLNKEDIAAVTLAVKTPGERKKAAKGSADQPAIVQLAAGQDLDVEVGRLEVRALRLGIPLSAAADGTSTVLDKKLAELRKSPEKNAEKIREVQALLDEIAAATEYQQSKDLWVVTRAGSNMDKPIYLICAKYWCVHDNLPLIAREFEERKACPFCGGKQITFDAKGPAPKKGETVWKRLDENALYAGYMKNTYHPKRFPIPCCFNTPGSIIPYKFVEGDKGEPVAPIPGPKVELPDQLKPREAATAITAAVAEDPIRRVDRLVSVFKVTQDRLKILGEYILQDNQFPLDLGKVGIVTPTVDAFLGQKDYMQKEVRINPAIAPTGRAFLRLGLGSNTALAGRRVLELATFVRFAVGQLYTKKAPLTPEMLLTELFETRRVETFHAFQQANYGTLVHEFAEWSDVTDGELHQWAADMEIPLPDQREYALQSLRAWRNFERYVRDESENKDIKLWEGLFAVPGLFSETGVAIARVAVTEDGNVVVRCPSFGVSAFHQGNPPPLLLLYEQQAVGSLLFEPLVLFDGPGQLLGVLDPKSGAFGQLSPSLRSALSAFYGEFMEGCAAAKGGPRLHPWLPLGHDQTRIPRLSQFIAAIHTKHKDLGVNALVRDRTHRLVGVRVYQLANQAVSAFIPVLDDGATYIQLPSLYDVEGLRPYPSLLQLLTLLVGASSSSGGLAGTFRGLTPSALLEMQDKEKRSVYVALRTSAHCIIPFEPLSSSDPTVPHTAFTELRKHSYLVDEMPWEQDIHLLGNAEIPEERAETLSTFHRNPDELFVEAYQHLRITVSNWLKGTAEGRKVRDQIELLRKARNRLPLFELRKRADLLLFPYVKRFVHVGPIKDESIGLLRRDCLQIKSEGECKGACSWASDASGAERDRCMIHASATPRFVDPVYVLSAKLVDELLRTFSDARQVLDGKVPRLRKVEGIVHGDDFITTSFEGRSEQLVEDLGLDKVRFKSKYARGLVFPEQVSAQNVATLEGLRGIPELWEGVQKPILGAEAARDRAIRFKISWISVFEGERQWTDLEGFFKPEPPKYKQIADAAVANLLVTEFPAVGGEMSLVAWYAPAPAKERDRAERLFVLVDPEGVPLQNAATGEFTFAESALPHVVREWLDTHAPVHV